MTGQTMISAAFFVMLTVAVLSANKMVLESNRDYIEAQAVEQGTNFANALISEILLKNFDVNLPSGKKYPAPSSFTVPTALGPTATAKAYVMPGGIPDVAPYKSIPGATSGTNNCFADVDDYDKYERTANASDIRGYHLKVSVYYVSKNSPDVPILTSGGQTYYKRIDITVDHPLYLPKPLKFSTILTY